MELARGHTGVSLRDPSPQSRAQGPPRGGTGTWKALRKAPGLEEGLQEGPCGQRVTSRSTQGGGKGRGQPMQGLVGHGQIQKFNSNVKGGH